MTEEPVDLDARRSAEGQIATDIRRHALKDFKADQRKLRLREEELEMKLLAKPASSWHEAAIPTLGSLTSSGRSAPIKFRCSPAAASPQVGSEPMDEAAHAAMAPVAGVPD
ncbi:MULTISPECIES: hypothetical protein [unclassified Phaeobacter]|uniref:hypothetical protein n=1 Tax=unclassified Phaeobacter TaxID=2621772 RepID=UPI003A8B3395